MKIGGRYWIYNLKTRGLPLKVLITTYCSYVCSTWKYGSNHSWNLPILWGLSSNSNTHSIFFYFLSWENSSWYFLAFSFPNEQFYVWYYRVYVPTISRLFIYKMKRRFIIFIYTPYHPAQAFKYSNCLCLLNCLNTARFSSTF